MGRLFVTGDTHGDYDLQKLYPANFPYQADLTKDDIVLILGDSGLCWDNGEQDKILKTWYQNRNFTTISVIGNHENYNLVERLPLVIKYGGLLYKVSDNLYYTFSGETYNFNGIKCLCINGAESRDKERRQINVSWWPQEPVQIDAIERALKKTNDADFLFSHTGGTEVSNFFGYVPTKSDFLLDNVIKKMESNPNFRHYCGHYHNDLWANSDTRIVYNDIIELT